MLSGCSTTVPVTAKFPNTPENLLVKCPQLEKLSGEPTKPVRKTTGAKRGRKPKAK